MLKNRYVFKILQFLKNLKLANQLKLILILVFFITFLISSTSLSILLQQRAQQEVTDKANMLSEIISATADFAYNIDIKLSENNDADKSKSYPNVKLGLDIKKDIFSNFLKYSHSQDYYYKNLDLSATQANNKFKTQIFEYFNKIPANTAVSDYNTFLTGFHTFEEGKSFYIARCVRDYEQKNFCFKNSNENIYVHIIYIPTSKYFLAPRQFWLLTAIMPFAISAVAMIITYLLLDHIIIKPIAQFSKDAWLVSTEKADVDFEQRYKNKKRSKDEIVSLAVSFNRLKTSLKICQMLREQEKRNN